MSFLSLVAILIKSMTGSSTGHKVRNGGRGGHLPQMPHPGSAIVFYYTICVLCTMQQHMLLAVRPLELVTEHLLVWYEFHTIRVV